jgi:CHAT domain-containing protein
VSFIAKGDSLINIGEYDFCAEAFETALGVFRLENNWGKAAESLNGICYCLTMQGKYLETISLLNKLIPDFERNGQRNAIEIAKSYSFKGMSYRSLNKYVEAINSYEKAIIIFEKNLANSDFVSMTHNYIAQIYLTRLNYTAAIAHFEKALESDSTHYYDSEIYRFLGLTYEFLNDYNKAFEYAQKGLKIKELSNNEMSEFLGIIASALEGEGETKRALGIMHNSLNLIIETDGEEDNRRRKYTFLAEIAAKENQYKLAQDYIKKAIKESKLAYDSKDRELAKMHATIGDVFKNINMPDSALAHYQQALIQVFPKFNSTNIADNPDIKDVYTESWIMTAAARKAQALHLRYQQKGDIADLRNAAYCYDLSLAGVKQLYKSYGSDGAKLYMGDYSHNYFEQAIEVNYLLYTKTGEQSYLRKILSLMEQSKASVLSDAIQKNKALLLTGIPDSLLELEKDLRISIADYTTQLKNTEVEGQDNGEEVLAKIKSQLSEYQLKHERLLEQMKADYPNFRAYIEEYPEPNFEDVLGKILDDKSIFVEFFTGGKAIYCLTIGRNGATILKLERNDDLECRLQEYFSFFKNSNAILEDPAGYLTTAHSLYKSLFSNTLSNANAGIQRLVLVPDGLLGYLPFDALVMQEPSSFTGFGNIEFLVKKYSLSYAYSANTLLQQKELHQRKGKLLRVMPRFLDGERGLAPLKYSDEETTDGIAWLSLEGAQATKAGFKSLVETCRLLHLSTHAESNAGSGEPYIELADGRLLLPELYSMNLSAADLVVLSACETGLGEVAKGEGVMSLARGFAYAGAGSLVASLWKVNERSTASLFAHFYQYLAEGKTKSEALRLAKLSLLENAGTDTRQSPYYWAGFVFMGNDGEMDLPSKWRNLLMVAGGVGLATGALVYFRKRRRKLTA